MRRGSLIMIAAAIAMVVGALALQRADVLTGQARYWQHEQQPKEDELPSPEPVDGPEADSAMNTAGALATEGQNVQTAEQSGTQAAGTTTEDKVAGARLATELCTHLPIVCVHTGGQKIPGAAIVNDLGATVGYETTDNGEEVIPVTFETIAWEGVWHRVSDEPTTEGTASFRIRGHSSRRFSKSSYLLNITEDYGSDEDGEAALLGMPKGTKWALHGPFLDKTLIRNYLCMNLCGEVMDQWVPEVRFCELVIDDSYQGVYVLMEMIEVQSNRLNLRAHDDGDLVTSYLARIEHDTGSAKDIPTFMGYTYRREIDRAVELLYPGLSHQTEAVRSYVSANLDEFERMLYANDVESWLAQVDLQSFVDYYVLEEFMAINDAFSASTYAYRDARGKLTLGPVWDFNNAFNNFFSEQPTYEFILSQRGWFAPLMRSDQFVERAISRWRELRRGVLSDESLRSYVYETQAWLGSAVERNYEMWGYSFDPANLSASEVRLPDVGSGQTLEDVNPSSFEEATEWMVNYMLNRAHWMDEHMDSLRQYCHPSRNL